MNKNTWLRPILPVSALLLILPLSMGAQGSLDDFKKLLLEQANFSTEDLAAIERGEVVVRLLPVADKREVAVFGVARFQSSGKEVLKAMNDSMAQDSESVKSKGRFSNRPALQDVETLTLEDEDIEDLRKCVVGACEVKISASMIRRFHTEVDWTRSDYRAQANHLFRRMLVDYVRDYLARGNSALIEYYDQKESVRLQEEQDSLLNKLSYLEKLVPELTDRFVSVPVASGTGVENTISWAKIKFGLKPSIVISHVITYVPPEKSHVLVITKQIYASHYFDSSLGLTAVVSFPANEGTHTYLLYTNRSRADALDGSFSKLKRKVSERSAVEKLVALLERTRIAAEINAANLSAAPPTATERIKDWLLGRRTFLWLMAVVVMLSVLFLIRRKPDVLKFGRGG